MIFYKNMGIIYNKCRFYVWNIAL